MKLILSLITFCCFNVVVAQQKITVQTEGTNTDIRGLSVVDDSVAWASGSRGWVATTHNGGKNWKWKQLTEYAKLDFRGLYAFNNKQAIICNAGSPAHILKTEDGGETWKVVYTNTDSLAFIDALAFWNEKQGIAIGDPINGRFLVLLTNDGGTTWTPSDKAPAAFKGEAAFAASGTCLRAAKNGLTYMATGGNVSRLLVSTNYGLDWASLSTPIIQGKSSLGIFSLALSTNKTIFICGGDWEKDTLKKDNYFYSQNGGKSWNKAIQGTNGFRSCIEVLHDKQLIATGTSGTDYSADEGRNWVSIDKESFNVVQLSRKGNAVYIAGRKGRIGRVDLSVK